MSDEKNLGIVSEAVMEKRNYTFEPSTEHHRHLIKKNKGLLTMKEWIEVFATLNKPVSSFIFDGWIFPENENELDVIDEKLKNAKVLMDGEFEIKVKSEVIKKIGVMRGWRYDDKTADIDYTEELKTLVGCFQAHVNGEFFDDDIFIQVGGAGFDAERMFERLEQMAENEIALLIVSTKKGRKKYKIAKIYEG